MKDKKVKAAFFDLGNVIIRFDVEILAGKFTPLSRLKSSDFNGYVMDSINVNRYMEGKINSSQFYMRTKRTFRMDVSFNDFYEAWNSIFFPYPEVEEIIRSIRKKYPEIKLILVSNTNKDHFDFLEKEYEILSIFDSRILSHEVGFQKPAPEIFNKALESAGELPKDTFYTDDRLDLIEAARVMGIKAFQFISHDKLRSDLEKVGILV